VGGVGEAEDVMADEVGGGAVAKAAVVGVGFDCGELLEGLEIQRATIDQVASGECRQCLCSARPHSIAHFINPNHPDTSAPR